LQDNTDICDFCISKYEKAGKFAASIARQKAKKCFSLRRGALPPDSSTRGLPLNPTTSSQCTQLNLKLAHTQKIIPLCGLAFAPSPSCPQLQIPSAAQPAHGQSKIQKGDNCPPPLVAPTTVTTALDTGIETETYGVQKWAAYNNGTVDTRAAETGI